VFRYEPKALHFGPNEIRSRALEWDEKRGQYLVSDWNAFSFIYEDQPNAPPLLVDLALDPTSSRIRENSGGSTDFVTTSPTVLGRITNEAKLNDIAIEVDIDGDGTFDRSTLTDENGVFLISLDQCGLLSPSAECPAPTLGEVSIQARTRELDRTVGQFLYGDWQSLQFVIEPASYSIAAIESLELAHDTGDNDSDRITTDSSLVGVVSGSSISEFFVVQFDHNNDAIIDGSTTVNTANEFSYSPRGLAPDANMVRARIKDYTSDAVPLFSEWFAIEFYLEGESSNAASSPAAAEGETTPPTKPPKSEEDVDNAAVDRRDATEAAESTRDDEVAAADTIYIQELEAANTQLQLDLAAFPGDTTSFTFEQFVWPDAPISNALVIPGDSDQPRPPVQPPSYSGSSYDFDLEPIVSGVIAAIDATFDAKVAAAEQTLEIGKNDAEQLYAEAVTLADVQFEQTYHAELASLINLISSVPPVDIYQVQSNADSDRLAAQDAFEQQKTDLINDHNAALQPLQATERAMIDLAKSDLAIALDHLYQVFQAACNNCVVNSWTMLLPEYQVWVDENNQVRLATWTTIEAAKHQRTQASALVGLAYANDILNAQHELDIELNEIQYQVTLAVADLQQWTDEHAASTTSATLRARAIAEHQKQLSLADAQRQRDAALNDLVRDYTVAVASAATESDIARATAERDAIAAWDTATQSDWTQYQLDLSQLDLQNTLDVAAIENSYSQETVDARYAFNNVVRQSEYDFQIADADSDKRASEALADNLEQGGKGEAVLEAVLFKQLAESDKTRGSEEADNAQTHGINLNNANSGNQSAYNQAVFDLRLATIDSGACTGSGNVFRPFGHIKCGSGLVVPETSDYAIFRATTTGLNNGSAYVDARLGSVRDDSEDYEVWGNDRLTALDDFYTEYVYLLKR
jgi:hypothetical protein